MCDYECIIIDDNIIIRNISWCDYLGIEFP